MNKILFCFLFISLSCFSQETKISDNDRIYDSTEAGLIPEFVGGPPALDLYIKENYKKPEVKNLKGTVFISFIVEKDGSITNTKTIRDIGYGTGKEAERIMQLSPKWYPGTLDEKAIRVLYKMAIPVQTNK
jgi:periplasmic protein TonB